MNIIYNELQTIISKHRNKNNVEIELRLGWKQSGKFNTNIQKHFYETIKKRFEHTIEKTQDKIFKKKESKTFVFIYNKKRIITDEHHNIIDCHYKKKIETIDIALEGTPYDLRISVSVEKPCDYEKNILELAQPIRCRQRTQYMYKNIWSYDLTEIVLLKPPDDKYSVSNKVYEFELELICPRNKKYTTTYLAQSGMQKILDIIYMNDKELIHLKNLVFN
jgi:hypothetical protein